MKKIFAILLSAAMLVAMFAMVVSADETNLALGKSYDAKGYTDSAYKSDYTADLTDGNAATELTFDNNWFAFCTSADDDGVINAPNGVGTVIIDLEAVSNIAAFRVNTLMGENVDGSGVNSASKISAYVSDTANGTYTYVGDLTSDVTEGIAWAELEAPAKGQFVKIEVTLNGLFCFINEIEVIEGDAVVVDPSEDASEEDSSEDSSVEEDLPEADLGEENEDAAFTMDITVPDSYKAGEEVVVTVTVNNVSATTGLQHVHGNLYFDTDMLGFAFELKENKELKDVFEYAEWESFVKLALDEEGNWYVAVDAATAGIEDEESGEYVYSDVTEDGVLVFNITFVAKEDAKGTTLVYIPNASVTGDYVDPETYETTSYVGNGSSATISEYVKPVEPTPDVPTEDEDSSDVTPPTGDASSMIFFAIIALVAIAGSAVVIKTRK